MSNRDLKLSLLLSVKDAMSPGLARALKTITSEGKSAESSLSQIAKTARQVDQSGKQAAQSLEKLAAAANKPKTNGFDHLTNALKNTRSAAETTLKALNAIAKTGAQVGAGGYVMAAAAKQPMSYERRLALLSNTANSNLNAAGRIAGQEALDKQIRSTVSQYGGTAESAIENLNALVGSGAFGNANQAASMLPLIQKVVTGTGSNGTDIAQILVAAKQTMNIADTDMPAMLSKAIKAGQEGGFELTDMAKWLPQQMTLAAASGMKGMSGFESLLAANQAGRIAAGTSDEAGNNLVNLLAKMNSSDTAKDFQKQGVDLSGSLAAARGKGGNTLEAFVALVERVANKDKAYSAAKAKADSAQPGDKKVAFEAMADILMQKGLGKTIQDRQALMQLLALIQHREKYNAVKGIAGQESGAEADTSFNTMAATSSFKSELVANDAVFAGVDALKNIKGPLDTLLEKSHDLAGAHTDLAAAAYNAITALGAIGAAGLGGGLIGLGKRATTAETAVTKVAASSSSTLANAAKSSELAGVTTKALVPAGLLAAADYISPNSDIMQSSQKAPPGLLDAITQGMKFSGIGLDIQALIAKISGHGEQQVEEMRQLAESVRTLGQRPIDVLVSIDGQQIAHSVNTTNAQQSRRN